MADTPELGRALAEFAAACSVMAEPVPAQPQAAAPDVEDAVPAFLGRAAEAARSPIRVDAEASPVPAASVPATPAAAAPQDTVRDVERRLGLREPES
jgi:hypothetical protein